MQSSTNAQILDTPGLGLRIWQVVKSIMFLVPMTIWPVKLGVRLDGTKLLISPQFTFNGLHRLGKTQRREEEWSTLPC